MPASISSSRFETFNRIFYSRPDDISTQDLIAEVTRLSGDLEDTRAQLERENELSKMYHKRVRDTESQLQSKQRQMVRAVL